MVPDQTDLSGISIGCRVVVDGHRGTVKYIGEVVDTKGTWLGIDWDDEGRGKHDGSHDGHSYFRTRCPKSGSFIRPSKANTGKSIVTAIKERYGLVEENAGVDLLNLAQVQKDIKASVFEVVGAEKINKKQSQFSSLQIVSLLDQPITSAGPPLELMRLCPNLRELDLSRTLISNWQTVADITTQLQKLHLLDLSENRLELPLDLSPKAFEAIKHLVLARGSLTWDLVARLSQLFQNLSVLQVPFNVINEVDISGGILSNVTCLDLEGNPLNSWAQVIKLGHLSKLESLNISSCSIKDIYFDTDESPMALFKSLRYLLLNDNLISDWKSISELDKLPALLELKCLKNPVLEKENFETNHQLIIARIRRVKVLNGLPVPPEERRGAELDFLKLHGREWLTLSTPAERISFNLKHPCYQRLIEKYGAPEESEMKKAPTCLKSNLIQVEIFAPDCPGPRYKKKIPASMSVQKLVGLVQRLYDTGSSIPNLYYVHSTAEVPLDNDLKSLSFYSVEDGALIAVRW